METIPVACITTEDGDDLLVSFVIATGAFWGVRSLTLMRDVKWEHVLSPDERGVHVSDDGADLDGADEYTSMLQELRWAGDRVHLRCVTGRVYELDVAEVEPKETAEARRILQAMNRDQRFRLDLKAPGS